MGFLLQARGPMCHDGPFTENKMPGEPGSNLAPTLPIKG